MLEQGAQWHALGQNGHGKFVGAVAKGIRNASKARSELSSDSSSEDETIKNVIMISRILSVSIGVSNSVDFIDFKYHKLQTAGSFLYGGEANANHMN